jgi:hypothetical protein
MEGSNTDTTTPLVQVDAPLSVGIWGVTVSRRAEGSKAYVFEVTSNFRSQFQIFGFTFSHDAAGGAYGPVVNDHINGIHARADEWGNISFYSTVISPSVRETLITTLARLETLHIVGVRPSSRCSMSATNALAAAYIGGTYISAKKTNEVSIVHPSVAGMTYDVICTAY